MQEKYTQPFKYALLFVLISIPIFGHLDTLPIRAWDEARLAVNAYEMLHNHNYVVTFAKGEPDMWNTKPPLMIWAQVTCMKLLGVSELSVRLPSAMAAFLTCLFLLIFALRYLKNFWFGFAAVLVLVTAEGFIGLHASRSGDYDAMLALFSTLAGLSFFLYVENKNRKQLFAFFAFMALAMLTKGITVLIFAPAFAIYALLRKQFLGLLKSRDFYLGAVTMFAVVLAYYFLREAYNPGYMRAVQENELGGRYLTVLEAHQHSFWYYLNNLRDLRFSIWYLWIPAGLLLGLLSKDDKIRNLTSFSALMTVVFLLVISMSQTKLFWYEVPVYPFLAIIIASSISFVFEYVRSNHWINENLRLNIAPYLFLFLVFIGPYKAILASTYLPVESKENQSYYALGYYLKDALRGKHDVQDKFVLYDGYNYQFHFYINLLQEEAIRVNFKDWKKLEAGDEVIMSQESMIKNLKDLYNLEFISQEGHITQYIIHDRKH